VITDLSDVSELFDGTKSSAYYRYLNWRNRPGHKEVVKFVEGFRHEHLFRVTVSDIESMKSRSEHALGAVAREESLDEVEDFYAVFALEHIFHKFIEARNTIPTFQEFRNWMMTDAFDLWLGPFQRKYGIQFDPPNPGHPLARALRWRLGKFYYSAVREVEVLVKLRERHGVPLKYHLLADVLLRVDFWSGRTLLCIYFPNSKYRDKDAGRKPPASTVFGDRLSHFRIIDCPLQRQGYGRFWTVSDRSIAGLASDILGLGQGGIAQDNGHPFGDDRLFQ
jgi:hypothetical protein